MTDDGVHLMVLYRALGFAILELSLLIFLGFLGLTVLFFVKKERAVGIICAFCAVFCFAQPIGVLIALVFGWRWAGKWNIRGFMALWSGLIAVVALNVAIRFLVPEAEQAAFSRSLFEIR